MIYTHKLHVAEAQTFFKAGGVPWPQSGTRIHPLTDYVGSNELIICRYKVRKNYREKVANRAKEDLATSNRGYGFRRAIVETWWYRGFAKRMPWLLTKGETGETERAARICTDYVLECMAGSAGLMVEEYRGVLDKTEFCYPGHFYNSAKFDLIPMKYLLVAPKPVRALS